MVITNNNNNNKLTSLLLKKDLFKELRQPDPLDINGLIIFVITLLWVEGVGCLASS